jgi:phospholipase C
VSPRSSPIQHVVIIIQENRSFDNLFNGFPGADTVRKGLTHTGKEVPLKSLALEFPFDPEHDHGAWVTSYDHGNMDGFDLTKRPRGVSPTANYAYVPQSETQPYWQMAQQYTIADEMFQPNTSGSFASHLYLVAAQSDYIIGDPTAKPFGCDAPQGTHAPQMQQNGYIDKDGIFPCISVNSLAGLADGAGVSWRYYTPPLSASTQWDAYDAISPIRYSQDWTNNIISPETRILTDIQSGYLAGITWVVPTMANSDHGGSKSNTGPQWVASIVNAIGSSQFWNSTAIFIVWDDWGGWYEHVPPQKLDVMGLSFRVPMLVVSPYAQRGYVSHVQHEWGSILKFTEGVFGLPSLDQTDLRADDLSDCFNFGQVPPRFKPIPTRLPPSYFLHAPVPDVAPDNDF